MIRQNLLLKIAMGCMLLSIQPFVVATSLTKNEFLEVAFAKYQIKANVKTLWLKNELQKQIKNILDHPYPNLRLRYWHGNENNQTVWFLDEIGKERPISFAVSIINHQVSLINVLKFRESRGGEIRMLSFTEQFNNISLTQKNKLDRHIDGITGATMSVSAMKKITRLALMLDRLVTNKNNHKE